MNDPQSVIIVSEHPILGFTRSGDARPINICRACDRPMERGQTIRMVVEISSAENLGLGFRHEWCRVE